jgi:hypothetical protein
MPVDREQEVADFALERALTPAAGEISSTTFSPN